MFCTTKRIKGVGKVFVLVTLLLSLVISPLYAFTEDEDYWENWWFGRNSTEGEVRQDINNEADSYEKVHVCNDYCEYYCEYAKEKEYSKYEPEKIERELWFATRELPARQEGLDIIGVIPILLPAFGEAYLYVNERVDGVVATLVGDARRMRARSISFSHEWHETRDVVSIVIYASITSLINRTLVRSINFCAHTGYELAMADVTASGMIPLASSILTDRMRRQPEQFYAAQAVNLQNQAFFITNHGLTILFDEFQLSAMVHGYVALELANDNIRMATISMENTYTPTDNNYSLIMVPLRAVSEQLGFEVGWNDEYERAELWRKAEDGDLLLVTWMSPGINLYHTSDSQRSLEAAPYLASHNVIYVPITFFEQLLTLSVYSIDQYGNITFLVYSS